MKTDWHYLMHKEESARMFNIREQVQSGTTISNEDALWIFELMDEWDEDVEHLHCELAGEDW